jgi:assimilatory nitrate reductase catalytic subunit
MSMDGVRSRISDLVLRRDGVLSADLAQIPAAFGLGRLPERLDPDEVRTLVCGFCSTGCALDAHMRQGRAVNLTPTPSYPVNAGMACPKGWEALTPLAATDRATTPYVRDGGVLRPVDWHTALRTFARKFRAIQAEHGSEALAFLSTGQITTEEMALLGQVARGGMGIAHGDSNTRQCMATAHVAYKESFGFDAPPFTYDDLEQSDVLVFIGANPAIAHPILWHRVMRNPRSPQVIVIDPRLTETAAAATHHFAPLPKSDLPLLYGLAHILLRREWLDRDFIAGHTDGFDDFARRIDDFTPSRVARETGLAEEQLFNLAALIRPGRRVSFWWTMGINQSHEGVRAAQAIINLALMTGNIGRPGTGANSITGQTNAMGSRLFSNITCLPGGRTFDAAPRAEVARILGVDIARIPAGESWPYDRIIDEIRAGSIRGLWVIATNPVHSWIDSAGLGAALEKLDCLVVQDLYHTTDTARRADVFLPAAGWGEKTGTFINSERRIGLIQKVARAPGAALADFHIFRLVAEYFGCADDVRRWTSPEAAFRILQELSVGQPCDFSGIAGYGALQEQGGIQWPCPAGEPRPDPQRRLFADGAFFHADGRARFRHDDPYPAPERPDESYPLALLTGRAGAGQWHTETRTGKSRILRKLGPDEAYIEIHPDDAAGLGIAAHQRVRVVSRRGAASVSARTSHAIRSGQVFMPMHFPEVNLLTFAAFDPHSRQPSYKMAAVRIEVPIALQHGPSRLRTPEPPGGAARRATSSRRNDAQST